MKNISISYKIFNLFNIIFFLVLSATMLFPYINVLCLSLEPNYIAEQTGVIHLIPKQITFKAYYEIWKNALIMSALSNSVFITIAGAFLGVIVTAALAYGLSNDKVAGVKVIAFMVVFTMMFHGGIIPAYILVKNLGLINSLWSLIIPSLITGYNVILMRVFFQSLPSSLAESAMIDGCTEVGIFFRIVLPLSAPIIATVTLFYAVTKWNAFFEAVLYVMDANKKPLQLILREIFRKATSDSGGNIDLDIGMNVKMATAIVATVPIVIVYPFLQKYFTKGILLGAVKG